MSNTSTDFDRIVLQNILKETKATLTNIALNKGTTVVALLRPKIREILKEATEAQKMPPLKD